MPTRAEIIAEARTWIGTPWQHQARLKGVGVDCIGLLACVAKDLQIFDYDVVGYSSLPDVKALIHHIEKKMIRISKAEALPGDSVLIHFDRGPQHLAILTDQGIIHALSRVGYVAEHRLSTEWKNRIWRAYRFPGVTD